MRQMHHSIARVLTKWHPTVSTLCLTIEKALELCRSYAQNKVQKHHPQRIPWLLVAVSNTTLLATALDWLKKEEDEQF